MKCVARTRGQYRNALGKIFSLMPGQLIEVDECPPFCEPLAGEVGAKGGVNFETAKEKEMLEATYPINSIKDYIFQRYGKKTGNAGKDKCVAILLDCRYRDLGGLDPKKQEVLPTETLDSVI